MEKRKKIDGLSRREKPTQDNIFSELDNRKQLFTNYWVFAVLILLLVFSLLVFGSLKLKRVRFNFPTSETSISTESLSDRASGIYGYGVSTMSFSAQEFAKISGADKNEFPLSDPKYTIDKNELILAGKLKGSWYPLALKIKLVPAVVDKKFSFLVEPNSIQNIVIYGGPKDGIESTINNSINDVLSENDLVAYGVELSADKISLKVVRVAK